MIRIVVVDLSAESRSKIVAQLSSFLNLEAKELNFIPRISIKPLSLQELKFHAAPEICVLGEELVSTNPAEIAQIKRFLPNTPLLAQTARHACNLAVVEQLARLGADDVMPPDISATDFLRKVVLLARRNLKQGDGKLILIDAGKGGVGVTTLTAALGEALFQRGKSVALIDCDFETQDLSRFLQVRPFMNENLRLLLDEQRAVTEEAVSECLGSIIDGETGFVCMPPPDQSDDLYDSNSRAGQVLFAVLEILDSRYDCVLVDMGSARGAVQKVLYRVADKVVFVVSNDPSCFYASVDRVRRCRSLLSADAQLLMVENSTAQGGLSNRALRSEFNEAAKLNDNEWADRPVPFCRAGSHWPGSGESLLTQGSAKVGVAIEGILEKLSLVEKQAKKQGLLGLIKTFGADGGAKIGVAVGASGVSGVLESGLEDRQPLRLPEPLNGRSAVVGKAHVSGSLVGCMGHKEASAFEDLPPEKLVSGAKFA